MTKLTHYIVLAIAVCISGCSKQPTARDQKEYSYSTFVDIQHPDCEFAIRVPQEPTRSESLTGAIKSYMFDCNGVDSHAHFRVELMPLTEHQSVEFNMSSTLQNFARLNNIPNPDIRTKTDELGRRGTYMGFKKAGPFDMKMHGELVVGEHSMLHCMVVEPLKESPSDETLMVIGSIRRK